MVHVALYSLCSRYLQKYDVLMQKLNKTENILRFYIHKVLMLQTVFA